MCDCSTNQVGANLLTSIDPNLSTTFSYDAGTIENWIGANSALVAVIAISLVLFLMNNKKHKK